MVLAHKVLAVLENLDTSIGTQVLPCIQCCKVRERDAIAEENWPLKTNQASRRKLALESTSERIHYTMPILFLNRSRSGLTGQ